MKYFRTISNANNALHLHADLCSSVDPNLNQVIELLQKLKDQLEGLFKISLDSNKAIDLPTDKSSNPVCVYAQSPKSLSPITDKGLHEIESDLPALAPLEVPQFDFNVEFGH